MSLDLVGQGGKGLQLKKNQTHFLKVKFQCAVKKSVQKLIILRVPVVRIF